MDYRINDPKIDADHGEILQLLDSLTRVADSVPADELAARLVKLKDHVVIHFVDEEFILERQYEMPSAYVARHKDEHRRIRKDVLARIASLRDAGHEAVRSGIVDIRNWIETHIRTVDAEMNLYLPSAQAD